MSHGKVTEIFKSIFGELNSEYAFLIQSYSEEHRYYHTLEHINDCLQKLDNVEALIDDKTSLQIALLYHDIFYDPKRKDNEEKSAEYAFQLLRNLNRNEAEKVRDLILLTKHPSTPETKDEKFLLDIDLSILGASPEVYAIYENNIRQEYIHVPKLLFKMGRKKLLKKFLKEDRLFHTDYFYDKYEKQARENLKVTITNL